MNRNDKMLNEKYSLTFNGKYYKLNIERINNFCLVSSGKTGSEGEITEAYETDENGEFRLSSKINREITTTGNTQEDMIVYDFIKGLVSKLLESNVNTNDTENQVDFGFALAFNTLIAEGMIEEITEKQ